MTVCQMLDYVRRRLMMEDRPVALGSLLQNTRSERALICMFLALLELVRLQAMLLRQERNFSEVFVKKHAMFDSVLNEGYRRPGTTGSKLRWHVIYARPLFMRDTLS